jgi:MFS superfamily sulfate permease-like transporter
MPQPTLAAIVIAAMLHLTKPRYIRDLFVRSPWSFLNAVVVIGAELTFGVMHGIALGVVLSLLILIYLTSHPEGAILGQLPGTEAYRDVRRHPEARTFPGLLIWRVGDDLFFASIGRMETALKSALAEVRPQVKHVLLDMSPVSYIDVSACDGLITFIKELKSRGVTIAFARVRDAVRENLQLSKIEAVVSPADFHERVTDGISAWQRREASHGIPSSHGPDQLKC